jgi:hypothetical protein
VDSDSGLFEASSGSAGVGADVEIDFFLAVDSRSRECRRSSIFPSDARSTLEIDLSFYSRLSSLRDSVTPVRRREDTEGDGDASVKVQIDCPLGAFSRMTFRTVKKQLERLDKKRLTMGKSSSDWREDGVIEECGANK